ncbi:hypothetical protein D3C76_1781120 [compost metagenome]
MCLEEGITHPRHAEYGKNSDHAGFENRTIGNIAGFDFAAHQNNGTGDQHHHLDHQIHRQRFQYPFGIGKGRA